MGLQPDLNGYIQAVSRARYAALKCKFYAGISVTKLARGLRVNWCRLTPCADSIDGKPPRACDRDCQPGALLVRLVGFGGQGSTIAP